MNKNNFAIAELCPEDDDREYFSQGVRVTPTETIATDGHALLRVRGIGEPEDFEPFVLPRRAALVIAEALPGHDHATIEHTEASTKAKISITNETADEVGYSVPPIKVNYPNTDKAIPNVDGAAVEMLLDLNILIPLLEQTRQFLHDENTPRSMAHFRFYNDGVLTPEGLSQAPQRIDAENGQGQELTAVIMPCRA